MSICFLKFLYALAENLTEPFIKTIPGFVRMYETYTNYPLSVDQEQVVKNTGECIVNSIVDTKDKLVSLISTVLICILIITFLLIILYFLLVYLFPDSTTEAGIIVIIVFIYCMYTIYTTAMCNVPNLSLSTCISQVKIAESVYREEKALQTNTTFCSYTGEL